MHAGINHSAQSNFWDIVIIGAGLGGLTCGAYLSQAGKRILILERADVPGGPCQTYTVRGATFSIGINTLGHHCQKMLSHFGISLEFDSAPLCLEYANVPVYFPFRWSLFHSAKKLGLGFQHVFKILLQLEKACGEGKSYLEAIERLTPVIALRELLLAECWYIGTPPDILPARAFRVFFDRFYGYQTPVYPREGVQAVPQALSLYIQNQGGTIQLGKEVQALSLEQSGHWKVQTSDRVMIAQKVVSNLAPQATLKLLQKNLSHLEDFPAWKDFQDRIQKHKSALSFGSVLMMLDRNNPFVKEIKGHQKRRSSTLLMASPVVEVMMKLQAGEVPQRPIINIVAPPCLDHPELEGVPVTVFTLWPEGAQRESVDTVENLVQSIYRVLEEKWVGFKRTVLWSEVLTPHRYNELMGGLSSCPAHTLESNDEKLPCSWPLPGLYAVGSGVGPAGSHAAAAMESGRLCAKEILC